MQGLDGPRHKNYVLFVDGDTIGPTHWGPLMEVISTDGNITKAVIFAAPAFQDNAKFQSALKASGAIFHPIPRRCGGTKDPNDIAIAAEAARQASLSSSVCIALAALDRDFIFLAQKLKNWGAEVVITMPSSRKQACEDFEKAGLKVLQYEIPVCGDREAKFMAVLQSDGTGKIKPLQRQTQIIGDNSFMSLLQDHSYMLTMDHPLAPACAKFAYVNLLCPVPVYPISTLKESFQKKVLVEGKQSWLANPGSLAYVLPMKPFKPTSKDIRKYGNAGCHSIASAGGPFIVHDQELLVHIVLRRLGFLDDEHNSDLEEAIDVFANMGKNQSALVRMGCCPRESLIKGVAGKTALIHKALLSPVASGMWQMAPSDRVARDVLAARKLVAHAQVSKAAMMKGLRRSGVSGLESMKTYNAMVSAFIKDMEAGHPQLRN